MKKVLIVFALLIAGLAQAQISNMQVGNLLGITTAQRDGLSIAAGQFPIIYNTTAGEFQRWNGAAWETWSDPVTNIDESQLDASVNASLDLADSSVQPGDIDTFSELDAIVADKSLANLNDAQTFSSNIDFGAGIDVTGKIGLNDGGNNVYVGESVANASSGLLGNTAVGFEAGRDITSGFNNSVYGNSAGERLSTGDWNMLLGTNAGFYAGNSNNLVLIGGSSGFNLGTVAADNTIAIGYNSARFLSDGTTALTSAPNSIYLGAYTKSNALASDNEIVIGYNAIGNGSNTVTIGNSSVTDNYFSGNLTATGTSTVSQYRLSALNTAPASATATGTTGEIRITADYIYVCVATNTWVRATLASW